MEPNDYQVGGKHYQSRYQHWDFVIDTDLHYLIACATKYIFRWREKNGIEDLRKACHYLDKAVDKDITTFYYSRITRKRFENCWFCFMDQIASAKDRELLLLIFNDKYQEALNAMSCIILSDSEEECKPNKNYIDPDNNYYKG